MQRKKGPREDSTDLGKSTEAHGGSTERWLMDSVDSAPFANGTVEDRLLQVVVVVDLSISVSVSCIESIASYVKRVPWVPFSRTTAICSPNGPVVDGSSGFGSANRIPCCEPINRCDKLLPYAGLQ